MAELRWALIIAVLLGGCERFASIHNKCDCDVDRQWENLLPRVMDAVAAINRGRRPMGSGFLIDRQHLVTASHVIDAADSGERLMVTFDAAEVLAAHVIAEDDTTGIAVLELEKPVPHRPLVLADVRDMHVGESVVALGNPFGMGLTASAGIVSALPGSVRGSTGAYLHTDATVHPGNSGGPLLDRCGRVVGLVTARIREGNIGLAVPSARIAEFLKQGAGVFQGDDLEK